MRQSEASSVQRVARIALVGAVLLALPASAFAAGGELQLVPDVRMTLTLIVLFILLIAPANRLIFQPLLRVLDEREERTAGTRARAARLEEEAREVLERYELEVARTREEAEQQRRSALERARGESQDLTGAARREAEQALERARGELATALEQARGGLRGGAEELAREAAARVLGRPL
jgi:F-type H+-transporting ATPase subunit b